MSVNLQYSPMEEGIETSRIQERPVGSGPALVFPLQTVPRRTVSNNLENSILSLPGASARGVCRIPKGVTFTADAQFGCDVAIYGAFVGNITLDKGFCLSIERGGYLEGRATADQIIIQGDASAVLDASQGVATFGPNCRFEGDVLCSSLKIEDGAQLEANVQRIGEHLEH